MFFYAGDQAEKLIGGMVTTTARTLNLLKLLGVSIPSYK